MSDSLDWLNAFERRAGRPLRVLHIGNIANNAYNNAKIQRAAGIDADVLSFDYYHIMACPEWEDADFTGNVGDDMFPDWWAVDLHGFERPRWFAQGPLDACIRHLLAQYGPSALRGFWWRMLEFERWLICRRTGMARIVAAMTTMLTGARIAPTSHPFNAAAAGWLARQILRTTGYSLTAPLFAGGPLRRIGLRLLRFARAAFMQEDVARHMRALAKRSRLLLPRANALLAPLGRRLKADDLDWAAISWWHPYMRLLLSHYDIVQAYATYTLVPLLAGREDYVAYEHGTIRAIPFQDDTQGRLCALTYRAASAVLVTNSDNIEATRRLGLDPDKVIWLPHAFDSGKLLRFAAEYRSRIQARARGPTVFFSPSRQDWLRHDPSMSKGNDRLIRALAMVVSRGYDCRVELIEWGSDVEASRKLAAELGLRDHVVWLPKMRKRELWARYLDADCVVDQFVVPAMGGVTFEAMILGRRVISAIDQQQAQEFFGETPPLFNAAEAGEVADAMISVIRDRDDRSGRGQINQDWMRKYHSQERIVDLQVEAYCRLLDPDSSGLAKGKVRTENGMPSKRRLLVEVPVFLALNLAFIILTQLLSLPSRARKWMRSGATALLRKVLPAAWWYSLREHYRAANRALEPLDAAVDAGYRRLLDVLWHTGPRKLLRYLGGYALAAWNIALWPVRFPSLLYQYRRAVRPRAVAGTQSSWPRHVVMLVVSDLRIDPRVERAARVLIEAGYSVTVIWPEPRPPFHADQPIDWGPGISFRPLPPEACEFVSVFPWIFEQRMLDAARQHRPFAFHCHDLTTAVIGLAAAREQGAYCVCDFHEWYSENVSWDIKSESWRAHPPFKRNFYRTVERLVMSRADAVITVCDSIARELTQSLSPDRREVAVIRNIPPLLRSGTDYPPLRQLLGVGDGQFLLLWQGGTGPSRMIEPIIRALAYSPRTVFVIRGPSLDMFGEGYRALAREARAEDRLVLLPPVPSADVVNAAIGADAGVWTLPNLSKNFYYALPNKIFEYLASGLPVLAANYPEARRMVEDNGVGLCFDPYDPRSIAAQINRMADDPALLRSFREAIPGVLEKIDAGREWQKLVAIYDKLGTPQSR